MTHIRKAVFPIAGLGTRFLPATKSVPKEMLPLVDKPLIQYALDEAREAGIEEFIFVTAAGKSALEDYFDTARALEQQLRDTGKTSALESLEQTNLPEGSLSFVRQKHPRGLGHAVSLARRLVGDEPFAVLLPDDVIWAPKGALSQLVDAHAQTGGHMVATMQVAPDQTGSYGVIDPETSVGRVIKARGMVEKPSPEKAPSTQAVVGRYILEPSIFDRLAHIGPGAGGELQLTDAICADIGATPVAGYQFEGERFDCGSVQGFVQATAAFALARADLSHELTEFLSGRMKTHPLAA